MMSGVISGSASAPVPDAAGVRDEWPLDEDDAAAFAACLSAVAELCMPVAIPASDAMAEPTLTPGPDGAAVMVQAAGAVTWHAAPAMHRAPAAVPVSTVEAVANARDAAPAASEGTGRSSRTVAIMDTPPKLSAPDGSTADIAQRATSVAAPSITTVDLALSLADGTAKVEWLPRSEDDAAAMTGVPLPARLRDVRVMPGPSRAKEGVPYNGRPPGRDAVAVPPAEFSTGSLPSTASPPTAMPTLTLSSVAVGPAGAPPSADPAAALSAQWPGLMTAVAAAVQSGRPMQFHLTPRSLGTVHIMLSAAQGAAQMTLQSGDAAICHMLRERQGELVQAAERSGVAHVQVSVEQRVSAPSSPPPPSVDARTGDGSAAAGSGEAQFGHAPSGQGQSGQGHHNASGAGGGSMSLRAASTQALPDPVVSDAAAARASSGTGVRYA